MQQANQRVAASTGGAPRQSGDAGAVPTSHITAVELTYASYEALSTAGVSTVEFIHRVRARRTPMSLPAFVAMYKEVRSHAHPHSCCCRFGVA